MKKGIKVTLSVCLGVLVALGTFAGVLALNGTCKEEYVKADTKYSNWMQYLSDDTLLSNTIIPGSHDSGTINMKWVSETQTDTIKQQLESGVRYFDLRVNKKKDNQYVMYHSSSNGVDFLPILSDIKSFIVAHPSETLLLDFQHFKNGSAGDVKSFVYSSLYKSNLLVENKTTLSDLAYISSLTLKEARGKCVVFFGDDSDLVSETYIFARNNDECTKSGMSLNSCYVSSYNKSSSSEYIEKGLPFYYDNIKNKISIEKYKGIFVLQGQLTDGQLIFGPWSKENKHQGNMHDYIVSLKNSSNLSLTNVIMRDFINTDKTNDIIGLNTYKGQVKTTNLDEFQNFFTVE